MSTTNIPATRPPTQPAAQTKPKTLRDELDSPKFLAAIAKALPKHLTPDRFARVAINTMVRNPKLADCDRWSFMNAMMQLSSLGLEPDGRLAHLIPFNNAKRGCVECQLIVDYKGYVDLAMRSGQVSNIHADVVCDNDEFKYNIGTLETHTINFRKSRGEVYAVYAIVTFKDGSKKCEVMSRDEIELVRKRSKAGQSGPWVTDWNEMAKKTAFRRLAKWLPLSPEYRDGMEADDDIPKGQLVPKPAIIEVEGFDMGTPPPKEIDETTTTAATGEGSGAGEDDNVDTTPTPAKPAPTPEPPAPTTPAPTPAPAAKGKDTNKLNKEKLAKLMEESGLTAGDVCAYAAKKYHAALTSKNTLDDLFEVSPSRAALFLSDWPKFEAEIKEHKEQS